MEITVRTRHRTENSSRRVDRGIAALDGTTEQQKYDWKSSRHRVTVDRNRNRNINRNVNVNRNVNANKSVVNDKNDN